MQSPASLVICARHEHADTRHAASERCSSSGPQRIGEARREPGVDPDITLVAVSKTFEAAAIEPVIAAGQRVFGENRVQEAKAKWPALRARHPDIELHLIGPLQTNKAAEAVALFDVIQTPRPRETGRRLWPTRSGAGRGGRDSSSRSIPARRRKRRESPRTRPIASSPRAGSNFGLTIAGLMCIPPVEEEPALHFALLARRSPSATGCQGLSMGMSADFETAIGFGATHVRVGSAIFGHRDEPAVCAITNPDTGSGRTAPEPCACRQRDRDAARRRSALRVGQMEEDGAAASP